jgi:hypothetical protein
MISLKSRSAILELAIQTVLDRSKHNLDPLRSHEVEALIPSAHVIAVDLDVSAAIVHREDALLLLLGHVEV